uniref:Peptidase M10 metallopeptidase domain-containing protein n=1 Tax=Cyclophora tenuis TaxID=216820 RepID=A0A7S1D4F7_CYCTE
MSGAPNDHLQPASVYDTDDCWDVHVTPVAPPEMEDEYGAQRRWTVDTMATDTEADLELARRMQQELDDEAYARRLQDVENTPTTVTYDLPSRVLVEPPPRLWTARRVCCYIWVVLICLGLAIVILYAAMGGLPFLPKGSLPLLDDWVDPFEGVDPSDSPRWRTNGDGLTLEIQKAVDSKWDSKFERAVSEWDNGSPDVLTLSTTSVGADSNCSPSTGRLKVCNGRYGQTDWYGINTLLLAPSSNRIRASTAKLNDSLLDGSSEARRQYTMCHEIGHGFGLPHTDENFFNANLHNCMDYTNKPESNQSPGVDNFEFLQKLYSPSSVATEESATPPADEDGDTPKEVVQESALAEEDDPIPDWVFARYGEAMSELESPGVSTKSSFDALDRNITLLYEKDEGGTDEAPKSRSYRIDLGGYVMEVHMLLVE